MSIAINTHISLIGAVQLLAAQVRYTQFWGQHK